MFENIPQSIISFIITGLFIWRFIPIAKNFGLVDKPGGHKAHLGSIPVIGGIGMFIGISFAFILLNIPWAQVESILIAGLLVLVVGSFDDKYFLSFKVRFIAQISAALIVITGDSTLLLHLGRLTSESTFYLGDWTIPLTVFAIVGVINAVNMSDGLDGLAGGLSIVTLSGIVILMSLSGTSDAFILVPLIFIAAISAFLMFNLRTPWLREAKIFMGNGGSMLLGVMLAWLLIKLSQGQTATFSPVIALWIFAIPLFDTVTIMVRRVLKGKSPFAPDREHLHHLFLSLGFSVGKSVSWVLGIATLFASIGILSAYFSIPEHLMFFAFLGVFTFYFWSMNRAWAIISTEKATIQQTTKSITGGTDNSIITPLKRERYKD